MVGRERVAGRSLGSDWPRRTEPKPCAKAGSAAYSCPSPITSYYPYQPRRGEDATALPGHKIFLV